ncbi:MAG: hypothetical protein ACE5J5_05235 [Candidatus Hydrothermarchaeales archaeon]
MVGETGGQEKYNVIEAVLYSAGHKEDLLDVGKGDFVKFSSKEKDYQGIILDLSTKVPAIGGPRSPDEEFESNFFHSTLSKSTCYTARILITSHRTGTLESGTDGRLISPYLAINVLDKNGIMDVIDTTHYDFLFAVSHVIDTYDLADLIVRVYDKIKELANFVEAIFRTKAIEAMMFANVELDSGFVGEFVKAISDSNIKGLVLGQGGNVLEILPLDGSLRMGDLLLVQSKKGDFIVQVDDFKGDKILVKGLEKMDEPGEYSPFVDQIERGAILRDISPDFMTDFMHTPETLINPIPIGRFYYGGKAYLGLHTLGRQGMLIVGGVGQKKTSSLLSIIETTIEKTEKLSFVIIDLNDEYGTENLVRLSEKRNGFLKIPVEALKEPSTMSIEEFDEFCIKHGLKGSGKADHRRQFVGSAYGYEAEGNTIELSKVCFFEIANKMYNKEKQVDVLSWIKELPDVIFETDGSLEIMNVLEVIRNNTVTLIDCSSKLASSQKGAMYTKCSCLFKALIDIAQTAKRFPCVLVIDEAHFFAPQTSVFNPVGFKPEVKKILLEIATIGPRNLLAPWVSTQRLAAVNKTLSTQMGQNILAFNLEDVDKIRLEEIVGKQSRNVEKLQPGECWVKSLGLKIPQIAKINIRDYPRSGGASFVEESGFIGAKKS